MLNYKISVSFYEVSVLIHTVSVKSWLTKSQFNIIKLGAYYNGPKFKCQLESGTG